MDVDGSHVRRLTHDSVNYFAPRFSPDGSTILFTSQTRTDDEIFLMGADGGHLTNLSHTPGNDRLPQFSPDGSRIVFTSDRDGNREIYVMNSDGSHQTRLTRNTVTDHSPQFSPDGGSILFFSTAYDPLNPVAPESYTLFRMNTDGSNVIQLTPDNAYGHFGVRDDSPSVLDAAPRFSPDGSRIVFQTYKQDQNFILIDMMSAGGGDRVQLVGDAGDNFAPFFFPNGSQILFRSHRTGDFDLYRKGLDPAAPELAITHDTGHTMFGDFSEDGSRILYFSNIDEHRYEYYHIYIADADGSNRRKLTQGDFVDYFPDFRPGE
jgi:Tol biopolymer transport system component